MLIEAFAFGAWTLGFASCDAELLGSALGAFGTLIGSPVAATPSRSAFLRMNRAHLLTAIGEAGADPESLLAAVADYREALEAWARVGSKHRWVATQTG